MTPSSRLARYVSPQLPEDRLSAQWSGSLATQERWRRQRRSRAIVGLAAVGAALALLVILPWRGAPEVTANAGTVVESGPGGAQRITLPDGSRVELGPATRVDLVEIAPRRAVLRLERGAITLDVSRRPERQFVVRAREAEVRVVGTRFRVSLGAAPGAAAVTVQVERGEVQVRARDTATAVRLGPGQSWADLPLPGEVAAPSPVPSTSARVTSEPAPPASSGVGVASPAAAGGDWRALRRTDPKAAYAALGPSGFAQAVASGSASDLFELYEVAKLSGHPGEAATALDQLRRRYPGDGRAGLAAFELGRLRQDQLGDPAGAVEALVDAERRGGAFGEDASARLVRAYQALGQQRRCEQARDNHLARYPGGAYTESVRRLCGR